MAIPNVKVQRKLFSVAEYDQMVRAGVLGEDDHVELIEGEIVEMSPIGAAHAGYVARLNRILASQVAGQALVFVQNPLRLARSEPEPDLALLRPRADDYIGSLPEAADVLLLIEVADTSADYDRHFKLPLYASAGIAETWLVDLNRRLVEVYRQPGETGYAEKRTRRADDQLAVAALPGVRLTVSDIFEGTAG